MDTTTNTSKQGVRPRGVDPLCLLELGYLFKRMVIPCNPENYEKFFRSFDLEIPPRSFLEQVNEKYIEDLILETEKVTTSSQNPPEDVNKKEEKIVQEPKPAPKPSVSIDTKDLFDDF